MWPALQETGIEQRIDVLWCHRAIGHAPGRCCDLKQWLEPIKTTRSGARDVERKTTSRGRARKCRSNFVCTNGERTGVAGDEHTRAHRQVSSNSASSRLAS